MSDRNEFVQEVMGVLGITEEDSRNMKASAWDSVFDLCVELGAADTFDFSKTGEVNILAFIRGLHEDNERMRKWADHLSTRDMNPGMSAEDNFRELQACIRSDIIGTTSMPVGVR